MSSPVARKLKGPLSGPKLARESAIYLEPGSSRRITGITPKPALLRTMIFDHVPPFEFVDCF